MVMPFAMQLTGSEILKHVFNPFQIGCPQLRSPIVIVDLRLPQDPRLIEFVIKLHGDRLARAVVDQHVAQVIDHHMLGRLAARHTHRLKFRRRKAGRFGSRQKTTERRHKTRLPCTKWRSNKASRWRYYTNTVRLDRGHTPHRPDY